ncbi:MAG: KH domain-containing protein [Candidatus Levybacteria bacterium]|nr:KH domain-containing protein [Candidatus Levybacteria bacterium]
MKQTLEYIVSSILSTKKVKVEEIEEDGITNFTVHVDKDNMGKIIGKEGKVIRAIRTVMRIPAIKEGKRVNVNLLEVNIK